MGLKKRERKEMERKKPEMDEEMKAWLCAGKVRMRLKNEMSMTRKDERYCRLDDYKESRPLWSPSNWSDDKNMTPRQMLKVFEDSIKKHSFCRFAKDEDLWDKVGGMLIIGGLAFPNSDDAAA